MSTIKEFLNRVEMFMGLSDEILDKIANLCQVQLYESDNIIVERRSAPDCFYLIQEGTVKISTAPEGETEDPANIVVVTLGNGQSFGEMGLVDRGMRSATVRAATSTHLLAIECQRFLELCEQDTTLGYQVMRNIATDLSFKLRHRNLI